MGKGSWRRSGKHWLLKVSTLLPDPKWRTACRRALWCKCAQPSQVVFCHFNHFKPHGAGCSKARNWGRSWRDTFLQEQGQREGAARLGRREKWGKGHSDQAFPLSQQRDAEAHTGAQRVQEIWRFGNSTYIWTEGLNISIEQNSSELFCSNASKSILGPSRRGKEYLSFWQSPVMLAMSLFRLHWISVQLECFEPVAILLVLQCM